MKRLRNFTLDLLIVVIVGSLLFMYIQDGRITEYQDYLLQFEWFQPLLISLAALLILMSLILVFSIFEPTHRRPGLYKDFDDGHVYVSRKAVEKTALSTVAKCDQVRQPNVIAGLYNKKNKSCINIKTDFFVPSNAQIQFLTEAICSDIRKNVEHFTEISIRKLEVNVGGQKTSGPRML